jgi:hypothetical protein
MEWYVYVIEWPSELGGGVMYIGKGRGDRMWQHLWKVRRPYHKYSSRGLYLLLNVLAAKGLKPNIHKVFETVSEQEAVEEERRLIASFPPLTLMNVQAGEVIINDAKRKSRDEEAAALLIVMKDELGSWGAVGERLGINKGLPYSVVTGRIKRSSPVRRALGLTLD